MKQQLAAIRTLFDWLITCQILPHKPPAAARGPKHVAKTGKPHIPDNNAAERGLHGIALGRKAWLFAGTYRGGERAGAKYSLIATAKLNDVDLHAWLADVIARIADHPARRSGELLPWHWRKERTETAAAA